MSNLLPEVIDVIASDPDYRAIALELAKKHPEDFLVAAGAFSNDSILELKVSDVLREQGRLTAIKFYRTVTNSSFGDANSLVKRLGDKYKAEIGAPKRMDIL